jgi:hypothetical protein
MTAALDCAGRRASFAPAVGVTQTKEAIMSKATFTPGEWTLLNREQLVALHTDEDGDHETLIADIFTEHDWARGNARLLRAAPELLAVAKLALNYLEGQEYLQACAIIAKAIGG